MFGPRLAKNGQSWPFCKVSTLRDAVDRGCHQRVSGPLQLGRALVKAQEGESRSGSAVLGQSCERNGLESCCLLLACELHFKEH